MAFVARSTVSFTRTAVPAITRRSFASARESRAAIARQEIKDRLTSLSVGSKEAYMAQIAEGESLIAQGMAMITQGRTGLETIVRTETLEREAGILFAEEDLHIIRERLETLEYFPQAVTSSAFEDMIKKKCADLHLTDSQISALVAAVDVSGDNLIQVEEFDAFLAKSGNKLAARVLRFE